MKIIAAQINPLVGAIEKNAETIISVLNKLHDADLIVFPELCLTGYPPEDLLLRPHLYTRCEAAVEKLQQATQANTTAIIIGLPTREGEHRFNSALCIYQGEIIARYHKHELPNYTVFDEKRYFTVGNEPCVFKLNDIQIGLTICEDIWTSGPCRAAKQAGAEFIISLNASPFDRDKLNKRLTTIRQRCEDIGLPLLYVNCVGGQDELVFDGGSLAINADGSIAMQAPLAKVAHTTLHASQHPVVLTSEDITPLPDTLKQIYDALVLGVRDYIQKNNFPGALIGLSGGIDSALTLAIAADAIGGEKIWGVSMPSQYTAAMSNEDAKLEADTLGARYDVIPIEPMFDTFLETLQPQFGDKLADTTEQNIQARIRGVLLMALSNKFGSIVLTTGNRSEMAVGYTTLYGDLAGGFSVLKDIPKTVVYELARYRNTVSPVIPERVITRAPSAELAPDQLDQDSLPPYDILDAIIHAYVDEEKSIDNIIAEGFDANTVKRVVRLIYRNEYKRRQAPPGIRISERAFGKDRRYPITSGY